MPILPIALLLFISGLVLFISLTARNEMPASEIRVANWVGLICGICFVLSLGWILLSTKTELNQKSRDFFLIQKILDGSTTIQIIVVNGDFIKLDKIIGGYIKNPEQHGVWVTQYYDCNYGLCYERDNKYDIDAIIAEKL
jgi:hypothetical protein